jgi:radical SAM superfamily enzyme YgiQ (UPF0313 family)
LSWKTTLPAEASPESPTARVVVVSADCTTASSQTPMLAPAFLVAHARAEPIVRERIEFDIRQFSVFEAIEGILEQLLAKPYDVVGFSCYVWNLAVYEQLIPLVRQMRPDAVLMMGGPQILNQEEEIFDAFPELDVLVYRDGEPAFRDLMIELASGRRNWAAVGGVRVRGGGSVTDTRARKQTVRFADIASPYLDRVITGRHDNLYLETYRGCPYTCAFCAWGGDEGPMNDLLPLERVRGELELVHAMGAHTLGFFDANFNQPPARAEAIFDMILERPQFKIVGMSVFAQTMREELAAKMSRVAATMIGVGLQSSDPEVNMVMKRRFRDEKMIAGVQRLRQHGLNFVLQVIIGLPGDTYDSIASSIEYALALQPSSVDVFRLMVLPGTEYRRRAEEFKLVYSRRPYHYVVSTCSMSAPDINRAERMGQAVGVFYNRPETRQEMFRQMAETHESVVSWGDAMGTFVESFDLLDRTELRKGDLIRAKDVPYLLKIQSDFQRFRTELSIKAASRQSRPAPRANLAPPPAASSSPAAAVPAVTMGSPSPAGTHPMILVRR